MPNQTQTLLRNATRQHEVLNILTFPTHERYQQNLAKTGHNFYLIQGFQGIKTWNDKYAKLPNNHTLLDPKKGINQIPPWIEYDLIISQQKFGQFQIAAPIAKQLGLPLVSLEHTTVMPQWTKTQLQQLKSMRGDINVFISEQSRKAWGWEEHEAEVIRHGIDCDVFKPIEVEKQPILGVCVNDYINRSWCVRFDIFQAVTGYPNTKVPFKALGDTPGFSKPAESVDALVGFYNEISVFLNTATESPLPTVITESLACGTPVVSVPNMLIPEAVIHGKTGFLSEDPAKLREYCQLLIKDESLRKELGENGRKLMLEKFSLDRFVRNWNELFRRAVSN